MVAQGDEGKAKAQKAVGYWYVKALDMFGHTGSKRSERYRYWGLKRRSNEQAREDYIDEVNPILEKIGLQVPDPLKGRHYLQLAKEAVCHSQYQRSKKWTNICWKLSGLLTEPLSRVFPTRRIQRSWIKPLTTVKRS
jgi:1,2-phenylacetyl-CoA epoxidase catalytic subunit